MPRLVGTEAGNFHIVMQEVREPRHSVIRARKELFLIVEARSPGEIGAHLEVLAEHMPNHIVGENPFRRAFIVGATCCVNMVIARPPAEPRGINPAPNLEGHFRGGWTHNHFADFRNRLWPTGKGDRVASVGQMFGLAVAAIDLGMKSKIRCQAFRRRWIDVAECVPNVECPGDGLTVFIADSKGNDPGRTSLKEDVGFASKSEVLGALADVERKLRLALTGISAVQCDQTVFER